MERKANKMALHKKSHLEWNHKRPKNSQTLERNAIQIYGFVCVFQFYIT
jgi:hypothetical protein